MGTSRYIRASDRDRDQAAELLRDAYAVGRLSPREWDERLTAAYSARTWGELQDLLADLPAPPAASLPSDIVARRELERHATQRMHARVMWTCLLMLVAGIASWIFPGAIWLVALAAIAMIISFTRGTRRREGGASRCRPTSPAHGRNPGHDEPDSSPQA
jgi:uncharacterized membrane protein